MLPSTELKENQPAPHSVGIQLPTVEPMIIPSMITRLALIVRILRPAGDRHVWRTPRWSPERWSFASRLGVIIEPMISERRATPAAAACIHLPAA